MLTAQIYTFTPTSDNLPADTDPNYQSAALCLMLRKTLENIAVANMEITRVELSDISGFNTNMNTWLAEANQRFDEWLQGQVATVAANLPDVLSVGAAYVSGGATEVGGLILQRVLGHMFHQEDSRAQHEGAHANLDTSEIEAQLEAINAKLQDSTPKSIAQIESELLGAISGAITNVQSTLSADVVDAIHTALTEFTINVIGSDLVQSFSAETDKPE